MGYVRDLSAGTTQVVTRGDGPAGPVASQTFSLVISGDGTAVAFITGDSLPATGGATDGNGGGADVYVRDGTTTYLASVEANMTQAVGLATGPPGIDFDGTAVAWGTTLSLAHTNAAITDGASRSTSTCTSAAARPSWSATTGRLRPGPRGEHRLSPETEAWSAGRRAPRS